MRTSVLSLSLVLLAKIATAGDKSFFEAVGISPVDLATSEFLPPVSSLATLPASDAEREELAAKLSESSNPEYVDLAVQLVEIRGDKAGALWILQRKTGLDPLHLVRLLYRTGDTRRAEQGFMDIQMAGRPGPGMDHTPRHRTFKSVWPILIELRLHEAAGFLTWLQQRCWQSDWKSAVLALRLEIALHSGTLEPFLKTVARESTVARGIAGRWLDPSTPELVPNADTSITELAWIVSIEGCTKKNAPYLGKAIESGVGRDEERKELLIQMIQHSHGPINPRMDLLNLWMKREHEFILSIKQVRYDVHLARGLPHEALCELAANRPGDFLLNYIAGRNQTGRNATSLEVPVTQAAIAALERAFLAAPLLAAAPKFNPKSNTWYPAVDMYYSHHWSDDPAAHSLQELRNRLTSTQLYELVRRHKDFETLPLHGRHRYLWAAALDVPATQLIFEIDWGDPANDIAAPDIGIPHGNMPPELREKYFEIQPRIMLGSLSKSPSQVAAYSGLALGLLKHEPSRLLPGQRRMLAVWGKGLLERGSAYIGPLLEICAHGPYSVNDALFVEIFGEDATGRLQQLRAERRSIGAKKSAIAWFGPAGLHGFPIGYEPESLVRPGSLMISEPVSVLGEYPEYPPSAWLVPRYPPLGAILESKKWGGLSNGNHMWAANLRRILPAKSSLAAGYDIAVVTGDLPAADAEFSKQAAAHVGQLLAEAMDADFVFRRACRGVKLMRGHRPEDPAAVEELMILRESSTPVRMAARDFAVWSNNEFRKRFDESFGQIPLRQGKRYNPPAEPPPPTPQNLPALIKKAIGIPDVGALARFLSGLPATHQVSPFVMLYNKQIIDRFMAPNQQLLLDVIRMRHEPATGTSGSSKAMRVPTKSEVGRLHEFFIHQDIASARAFRELVVERDWPQPAGVAEELFRNNGREEAVRWLAGAILNRCYPPAEWQGTYRFPRSRTSYYLGGLDRFMPHDALELIAREKLALPVAAAMQSMPHGDDPLLLALAFLRFFDAPSLESFDLHLGGLDIPDNPTMSKTALAIHIGTILERRSETRALAKELQNRARGTD